MVWSTGCGGDQLLARHASSAATFQFGGLTRSYRLHVPPAEPLRVGDQPRTVVAAPEPTEASTDFDVGMPTPPTCWRFILTATTKLADGVGSPADRRHLDDVGFWSRWPQSCARLSTSPARPSATGMSNGGFMSNRRVTVPISSPRSRRWRARWVWVMTCNPSRPSVLEHGTADSAGAVQRRAVRGRGGSATCHPRLRAGGSLAGGRWVSGRSVGVSCLDVGDGTMVHLSIPAHVRPAPR